jgi:hypothetical protein
MIRNIRGMIVAASEMCDRVQAGRLHKFGTAEAASGAVSLPAACKPICKPDATEWDETEETEQNERAVLIPVRRGHRIRERLCETRETYVALLITQRSRVQIPPPLPRREALSRTEKGPLACGLSRILCTGGRSSSAFARLVGDFYRSERATDDQLRERVGDLAVGLQVGLTYCFIVNATSA